VLVAIVALAAGCGSDGRADDEGPAATGPVTAERLTIALAKDSGPLNIFADQSPAIDELVYDKLLAPSPYVDQPRPWLATAVRQVDPSTWEVDLRDDVRWQDGEPFDATDVAFSFDYFKKAPTGTYTHHVSDIPTIETITALSPTQVRFNCAFPSPRAGHGHPG
jgi:peptide/nickel transport system substrate-binding protein